MRSELQFFMHPLDEREFHAHLLERQALEVIPSSHSLSQAFTHSRDFPAYDQRVCYLWDRSILPELAVRTHPHSGFQLDCHESQIQWLRGTLDGAILTAGRIAVATTNLENAVNDTSTQVAVEALYKALRIWIKKRYRNGLVATSDNAPIGPTNPSKPISSMWVGPAACSWLERAREHTFRQFPGGGVRYAWARGA
jgi:hypothetical protein